MSRDQQSIQDIWDAAQEILSFTADMDKAALAADSRTQAAVLYKIIVIGEATNRLSDSFREQHSEIPWKDIVGMRNILTHDYNGVNPDEVWNVLHQDIPELIAMIEPLLPNGG
jgi:uncharacterized protein with HEPN domain